jgi:hypothetical protein
MEKMIPYGGGMPMPMLSIVDAFNVGVHMNRMIYMLVSKNA